MQKVLSRSLMRIAKKGVSISALVSICSSLITFSAALPASAAGGPFAALTSLTSTVSSPKLSDCNVLTACSGSNNPVYEYTNVSYTWKLSQEFVFAGDTECVINGTACVTVVVTTDQTTNLNSSEIWADTVDATDVTYSGPTNSHVLTATPSDADNDNADIKEALTVEIGCTAACTFNTTAVQTMDIVSQPMYTPYKSNFANTNVYKSYPVTLSVSPYINYLGTSDPQAGQTVDNYGGALNVTASIDASLTFEYSGTSGSTFYTETTIVDSADGGCYFGTLTPDVSKVCVFDVVASTNAPNGFSIYVVQDQNMTFNGNTIKQFTNGTRTDDPGTDWASPSTNAGAHLGYSSNDESVFPASGGIADWAGIPTKVAAGVAASSPVGLVANESNPGLSTGGKFALKIEAGVNQPQAVSSLGQEYSNNLYFIVVGNF